MKNFICAIAFLTSLCGCTERMDPQPTEIPNPSMDESGSARANSTTNATANPELDVNTSTNMVDAESYNPADKDKNKSKK